MLLCRKNESWVEYAKYGYEATFDEFVKNNSESDLGKLINSLKKEGREDIKGIEDYSEIISKGDVQSRLNEYKEVGE